MNRIFEYCVADSDLPAPCREYLKRKGCSHQILVHLKKTEKGILVNNEWAYVRTPLQAGDLLKITLTEDTPFPEHCSGLPCLCLLFMRDEDILLLNKPADMPVHPSVNNYDNTLANGAAWYYAQQGKPFVFRCINRLDRDTTGLLILAKTPGAFYSLCSMKKEIHRTYQAIVKGVPIPESGTIDAPIARKEGSAIERCVDFEKGERAVTHYRVLDSRNDYSLVQLSLETGRTHQIRVHMDYLGHPLLGDYLYYPDFSRIKRVSLHSYALSFTHPMTGSPLTFRAPLPEDMADLFA